MKNSYGLENGIAEKYKSILNCDKIEIDNPHKHHYTRINYLIESKMLFL